MKKLNILLALGAVLCFFQGYGAVSQQEMNKLKTKISAIITDDAVNANGKMIDNDVINKVIDYRIAVLEATSPASKDDMQNALDTVMQQRLDEIKARKQQVGVVAAISPQEISKWTTDLNNIITDDAVNVDGKMIDNDVINKVIDYNIAVLAAISPANQDYVQNTLDTIRQQRLQEITAQKKKPEPKGKNIKKSARRTHSKGRRINLLAR